MYSARLCLPFSWVLFLRSWRSWTVLLLVLAVAVPFSYHSRQGTALSCCALFIVVLTLFNSLSLVDPLQQGSSYYPAFMLQLPLSDLELVVWPMVVTAVTLGVAGLVLAVCVLGSLHSLRDTWWLSPYLGSTGVLFQTAYWLPMRRTEWRLMLNLVAIVGIAGGPIALGFDVVSPVALASVYLSILVGSIVAMAQSMSKMRHGLVGTRSEQKRYVIPVLPAFGSRIETQAWLEETRNGRVMTGLTVTFISLFGIGAVVAAFGSPDNVAFQGQRFCMPALVCAGLLLVFPAFIGYGGCCASEPDNLAKDRSIVPFLALRPLTDGQILEAKIRMAARVVLRLSLIQVAVALGILLLPMNVDGRRVPTLVSLMHALSPGQAAGAAGLFLVIALIGIKGAISGIWASLARLSTFTSGLIGFIPLGVAGALLGWLVTHAEQLPTVIRYLPWFVWVEVVLKVGVLCWAIPKLRRRRLVTDDRIGQWLAGCAVIGGALFAFGCLAIPAAVYNRPALGAQVFCLLPLGRVALTPLCIHRGRHG